MGNGVAGAACVIFLMDRGVMRLTVAFLTGRQLPMGRMAFGTCQC